MYTIHLPLISNYKPGLKDLFGKHGIQFGFSVGSASFRNETTRRLIVQHANIVTTENALKMEVTQPERGVFDFSEGDAIVAAAHELGIDVHGHTASWHMQNPKWLVEGEFTYEELAIILMDHVDELAWHYSEDQLVSLGTANEAYISPDGSIYGGPWQPLDEDYVTISFLAKQTIGCLVMYNSFMPYPEHEYTKALNLLDKGWADAIGIQLHLWDGSYQEKLSSIEILLSQLRQRGSWCRFSEVSVLAANEQAQAAVYAAVAKLAIKYSDVVRGVIVWGVKDPAWRGNVTLFNKQGEPKLSYHAVVEELKK